MTEGLKELKERSQELSEAGFQLVNLETTGEHAVGTFRAGEADHELRDGLTWPEFQQQRQDFRKQGLWLIDFEIRDDGDEFTHDGIWAPRQGDEVLARRLDEDEFSYLRTDLAPTHHLVDFETYSTPNGAPKIDALWHTPPAGTDLVFLFMGQDEFLSKALELNPYGYRLVEIEVLRTPDGRAFSGRWQSKTANDWLLVGSGDEKLKERNEELTGVPSASPPPDPGEAILNPTEHKFLEALAIYRKEAADFAEREPAQDGGTAEPPPP